LERFFRDHRLTVALDKSFTAMYVPLRFPDKDPPVNSIMIEINRSLYMNEEIGEKLDSFNEVKRLVKSSPCPVQFPLLL
jgi:hypothetical protein